MAVVERLGIEPSDASISAVVEVVGILVQDSRNLGRLRKGRSVRWRQRAAMASMVAACRPDADPQEFVDEVLARLGADLGAAPCSGVSGTSRVTRE